ncbi:histidine kinase/DNA gyrase B/HSP90-like ATPase [Ruminiclostridium sufflavum DSM 19573]|uniref:Histidine kinase/DNA gyrase B/HSP90-like ATPase n=1 Tax=Ruminiclostridium sufflavum DSM 19573 TaxID=1121337 RepID=A0A318XJ90_9FIRM|nr:ATP-binding protein [Ruminiclostridium sufflavum]PYG86596.1 histidine kinase/DNA gyrase B/HSP90-like ATPase [Ruminiclostridium sufflavum DSM 19573]
MINPNRDTKMPMSRILNGISNFGYTTSDAILDIVDNCIVAKAQNINIIIGNRDKDVVDDKSVQYIAIQDDGIGMDIDQIFNALMLGSPKSEKLYEENSLSKFGFGLKSAGFSQAKTISVISRTNENEEWVKSFINIDSIVDENHWVVFENEELTDIEKKLVENCKTSGTLIMLIDMSPVNEMNNYIFLTKQIKEQVAITYHRIMEEDNVTFMVDNETIEPYDPLFCKEIKNIVDEYDGKNPCNFWSKEKIITINSKTKSRATLKAVQLPYPPGFKEVGRQSEVQKGYKMYLKNIGFYIYRNKRLISQAVTLKNICPRDQDHMSLRIRIDLDSKCDNDVNLDVKKTRLEFSDKFLTEIKNQVASVINQSKNLWELQSKKGKILEVDTTEADRRHERSNKKLAETSLGVSNIDDNQRKPIQNPLDPEIKAEYSLQKDILEEIKEKSSYRVTNVQTLERDLLWEPYVGNKESDDVCVALSREHSFYDKIYKELTPGSDEVVLLDAFFLSLAMAEIGISATNRQLSKVFKRLRLTVSGYLNDFTELQLDDDESGDFE